MKFWHLLSSELRYKLMVSTVCVTFLHRPDVAERAAATNTSAPAWRVVSKRWQAETQEVGSRARVARRAGEGCDRPAAAGVVALAVVAAAAVARVERRAVAGWLRPSAHCKLLCAGQAWD